MIMKPIPGYNGRYSATDDGRIFSHVRNIFLVPFWHHQNYRCVKVAKEPWKFRTTLVHRLVCLAFHGEPPEGKTEVNHIDFDTTNNRPDNLEWCSGEENRLHSTKHNRTNPRFLNKKAIYSVATDGTKTCYNSFREARDRGGFNPGGISLCISGKKKTYKGLQWFLA